MNIIWLSPQSLLPATSGGRIGPLKKIEYFSKNNSIYMFCIIDREEEALECQKLTKYCKKVYTYNRHINKLKTINKLLRGPYICSSRWIPQMKKDIDTVFNDIAIDYVIVEFPQMLGNISESVMKSGKVVLSLHNLESDSLRNIANGITNPIKKAIYIIESKRFRKLEDRYYKDNKINLYTFLSVEEKSTFEERYKCDNTLLVPLGVDDNLDKTGVENKEQNLIFVGDMSYKPNDVAAKWFIKNVWSGIKKAVPNAKFYAVGRNPSQELCALSNDAVVVTGTVDSIKNYYKIATSVVIPLHEGGGVKMKLMEALSYGKLVITTSKGIEGTLFKSGVHVLVEDDPKKFESRCIEALLDASRYKSIAENGYKKVITENQWNVVEGRFERYLMDHLK